MACPLWPLHLLLMYLMALCPVWLLVTGAAAAAKDSLWNVTFQPDRVEKIVMDTERVVNFWSHEPLGERFRHGTIEVRVSADHIATVVRFADGHVQQLTSPPEVTTATTTTNTLLATASPSTVNKSPPPNVIYLNTSDSLFLEPLNLSFALRGTFLGYTEVRVRASPGEALGDAGEAVLATTDEDEQRVALSGAKLSDSLVASVIRVPRVVDKVFIYSVAVLMALNYVNMGCTLDLDVVKSTLRRPIGPFVGVLSQYLFMPLISFGLSYAIFDEPSLRLGLFTAGCSPGGGASNMWTFLLGGNLNLSITMTFFSNIFAFATMPLWLFTLGSVIFHDSRINIPYLHIVTYVVALVLPVGVGVLLQLYLKRVANVCRRLLGPFSMAMILFIVVFGIYTNLFMVQLFSWRLFVAGLSVPLLGYIFGAVASRSLGFPAADVIAVAVETGVQNTGIAIILLRVTLPQPEADLTSVVPVALATMTPLPLLAAMLVFHVRKRFANGGASRHYTLAASSPTSSDEESAKRPLGGARRGNESDGLTGTINGPRNGNKGAVAVNGTHPDDRLFNIRYHHYHDL